MTEKELLKKLGIWPNLNGYQYLLKGVELIRENPDLFYLTLEYKALTIEMPISYSIHSKISGKVLCGNF
ncbi:hypothetical protein RJD28_15700 [Oscillospiraceae bacterium NTUH-002-81]|jgi:hypothetical protein|nr:hypothetical protein RJD28_15700 [Oscillospiraceae bacterium NTUH-002-81]